MSVVSDMTMYVSAVFGRCFERTLSAVHSASVNVQSGLFSNEPIGLVYSTQSSTFLNILGNRRMAEKLFMSVHCRILMNANVFGPFSFFGLGGKS